MSDERLISIDCKNSLTYIGKVNNRDHGYYDLSDWVAIETRQLKSTLKLSYSDLANGNYNNLKKNIENTLIRGDEIITTCVLSNPQ